MMRSPPVLRPPAGLLPLRAGLSGHLPVTASSLDDSPDGYSPFRTPGVSGTLSILAATSTIEDTYQEDIVIPLGAALVVNVVVTQPDDGSAGDITLAQVKFDIVDLNGQVVASITSPVAPDGSATATFENLPAGYYRLVATVVGGYFSSAATDIAGVIVNTAPVVGPITASAMLVPVGGSVTFSAPFSDAGVLDTHTARWNWGDGTGCTTPGLACFLSEMGGSGTVSGSHLYATEGVYEVKLTVSDNFGASGSAVLDYVTVYDPSLRSYSTGGGWIDSPAGACPAGSTCAGTDGKASFGFNAKPDGKKGTPKGETQFSFGNLKFHSTSYSQLVISGAWARVSGSGQFNNGGSYQFMLMAVDGEYSPSDEYAVDRFRMRIWDSSGRVLYDNGLGAAEGDLSATTALAGGSITVHAGN